MQCDGAVAASDGGGGVGRCVGRGCVGCAVPCVAVAGGNGLNGCKALADGQM